MGKKKVGQYFINTKALLGEGQFGKVYEDNFNPHTINIVSEKVHCYIIPTDLLITIKT